MLLSAFSIIGGGSALLLLLVPVGRITVTYPDKVVFGLTCEPNSRPSVSLYQEYPCQPIDPDHIFETEMQLESCGVACQAVVGENYTREIMMKRSYEIRLYDVQSNSSINYSYNLSEVDVHEPEPMSKSSNHKKLKNNERYLTSIRKLSLHSFYFPTTALYNFSCDISDETYLNCVLGSRENFQSFKRMKNPWNAGLKLQVIEHDDFEEGRLVYQMEYINSKKSKNISCSESVQPKKHISVTIPIDIETDTKIKHLDLGSCSHRCIATAPRAKVCSNMKTVLEVDMSLTFWSYLCVRVFVGIISGTSFAMFEGAVIAILREHKADYGLQRIYATIGGMISSPISGWMIDYASRGKGYTDFR